MPAHYAGWIQLNWQPLQTSPPTRGILYPHVPPPYLRSCTSPARKCSPSFLLPQHQQMSNRITDPCGLPSLGPSQSEPALLAQGWEVCWDVACEHIHPAQRPPPHPARDPAWPVPEGSCGALTTGPPPGVPGSNLRDVLNLQSSNSSQSPYPLASPGPTTIPTFAAERPRDLSASHTDPHASPQTHGVHTATRAHALPSPAPRPAAVKPAALCCLPRPLFPPPLLSAATGRLGSSQESQWLWPFLGKDHPVSP